MKYLVLLGILLVIYFIWRSQRQQADRESTKAAPPGPGLPQDMVRCPVCSLHLPRAEALIGNSGSHYCSSAHRSSAGDPP